MALPVYLGAPVGSGLWPADAVSPDITIALTGVQANTHANTIDRDTGYDPFGELSVYLLGALPSFIGTPLVVGLWPYTASSSDVTVALTGAAYSASVGTIGCGHGQALSGASASSAQGASTLSFGAALTGFAAVASAGTITVSTDSGVTAAVAGVSASSSTGTVSIARGLALSGSSATASQGSLSPSHSSGLTGAQATASVNTLSASVDGSATVALSGYSAATAQGQFVIGRATQVTSADQIVVSVGTIANARTKAVSEGAAAASVGAVSVGFDIPVAGRLTLTRSQSLGGVTSLPFMIDGETIAGAWVDGAQIASIYLNGERLWP